MPSRRTVLAAGAVALSTGLAGCNDTPPPQSSFDTPTTSWQTVGYDPAGTGHAPAGPDEPSLEWTVSRQATNPPLYGALSTPVVSDSTVYVAGLATRFFSPESDYGWVIAIDAEAGTVEWHHKFVDGLTGAPAVSGELVVVGGYDGRLYTLRDGEQVWSVTLGGQVGTPTTYGDRIYVGDSRGNVHAIAIDGTKRWTVDRTDFVSSLLNEPEPVALGTPAVDESGVYLPVEVTREHALLFAYDHTGSRRWQYKLDGQYGYRPHGPAITSNTAYATVGGTVHAVDTESGEHRWQFVTGAEASGPPSTDGEQVYVGAKNLYALDAMEGIERWRVVNEAPVFDRDARQLPYLARPPVADDTVYLRAGAFDAADGTRLWGNDADEWLVDGNYYIEAYHERPMAQPVITENSVFLSHSHYGVQRLA